MPQATARTRIAVLVLLGALLLAASAVAWSSRRKITGQSFTRASAFYVYRDEAGEIRVDADRRSSVWRDLSRDPRKAAWFIDVTWTLKPDQEVLPIYLSESVWIDLRPAFPERMEQPGTVGATVVPALKVYMQQEPNVSSIQLSGQTHRTVQELVELVDQPRHSLVVRNTVILIVMLVSWLLAICCLVAAYGAVKHLRNSALQGSCMYCGYGRDLGPGLRCSECGRVQ